MLPKLNQDQNNIKQQVKKHLIDLGFPVRIGLAQICAESRFIPDAVSPAGALGVAQFMPSTFAEVKKELEKKGVLVSSPFIVKDAIISYVYYMLVVLPRQLKSKGYAITWENLFRAYNAGVGNLKKSFKFEETNNYIKNIYKYMEL